MTYYERIAAFLIVIGTHLDYFEEIDRGVWRSDIYDER